jgi:hypothetical protein
MEVGALGIIGGAIVRFRMGPSPSPSPSSQPPPRFLRCSTRPVPVPLSDAPHQDQDQDQDHDHDQYQDPPPTAPNPSGIRIRRRSSSGTPVHYVGPFQFRLETEDNTPSNILEQIVWHKDSQVTLVRSFSFLSSFQFNSLPSIPYLNLTCHMPHATCHR